MNTPREWEGEFERRFGNANDPQTARYLCLYNEHLGFTSYHEDVKSFIRTIEDKAREEERERVRKLVEGMRQYAFCGNEAFKASSGFECGVFVWERDLDDIITALNEKI